MKLLSVASEVYPLVKTGGLADVAGALPMALAAEGVAVRTLAPGYPQVMARLGAAESVLALPWLFGGPARLLAAEAAGLNLLILEAPHLFDRPGGPYADAGRQDWPDNVFRFAALARAAATVGQGAWPGFVPDVVHCHDWQAGLVPAYLTYDGLRRPPTVMTVHNLAFQGQFPPHLLGALGLPDHAWSIYGVEYFGTIGFLKAGLQLSDRITTVSPSYAAEICTPSGGMALDGLLRTRAAVVTGILNGIDETVWDPAADLALAEPFDARRLPRRAANRTALRARLGLDDSAEAPLFAVVSRMSWQKGLDLIAEILPNLVARGGQLAFLGAGDAAIEAEFRAAARDHPGRVAGEFGYDEPLAHLMQGGADALLVPSRFEPCGLTQLCALRYGALPVVARVGGLADTVIDANAMAIARGIGTGVQFAPTTAEALDFALTRTLALWNDQALWRKLQRNAMATDVSWRGPAREYVRLYQDLMQRAGAPA